MVAIELISQQEAEYIFNAVNHILRRNAEPYASNCWQNLVKYSFDNYPSPRIHRIPQDILAAVKTLGSLNNLLS